MQSRIHRREFIRISGLSVAGFALGRPFLPAASRSADKRPNIVFIMTDQQSADIMSCRMGRRHLHTPAMDRLAREGMTFTRAYTPNPICMPARASIFTGRYPHETGVSKNGAPPGGKLAPELGFMGLHFRQELARPPGQLQEVLVDNGKSGNAEFLFGGAARRENALSVLQYGDIALPEHRGR